MTAIVAFCSSIHTAAITAVANDLDCSTTVSTLGVSTFLIGFASGPLLFAPLSEMYGRNPIYRITFLLFAVFNLGCALSPNIASLLVFRFLCGFFGSPTGESTGPRESGIRSKGIDSHQLGRIDIRSLAAESSLCASGHVYSRQLHRASHEPHCRRLSHRVYVVEMVNAHALQQHH